MKKKMISLLACICVAASFTVQASAATKTIIMDNDALASSGTTNPAEDDGGMKFGCSNMDYVVGPNHYNEDARRTPKSQTGSYAWRHSFPSGTNKVKVSVYLWDPLFTDPNACYDIGASVLNYKHIGNINQDKAKGGWNDFDAISYTLSGRRVCVTGTGKSGIRTGADAVKVVCTY